MRVALVGLLLILGILSIAGLGNGLGLSSHEIIGYANHLRGPDRKISYLKEHIYAFEKGGKSREANLLKDYLRSTFHLEDTFIESEITQIKEQEGSSAELVKK